MLRLVFVLIIGALWGRALAAELSFDLSSYPINETPPGFTSTLTGEGKPGEWKVILEDVVSAFPPLTPNAPTVAKKPVLAQLSTDPADEHFPLLIYDRETFGDFTLSTRFKTVSGKVEQMAGLAFRIQDENNYYYVRASSLGNTFRFFKIVDRLRSPPIGPEAQIPSGVWHEMTIECKGNRIRCLLNGKELIPALTDHTFLTGKIGFWTKSDSVSYFVDTRIVYTPREGLGQVLVREMMQKYPRLVGLKIYTLSGDEPKIIASSSESEIGKPGSKVEREVILQEVVYYGKVKRNALVTLPLHDRNGETVAAVRVTMKSFPGQTDKNAVGRAQPIVKEMEARVRSAHDKLE